MLTGSLKGGLYQDIWNIYEIVLQPDIKKKTEKRKEKLRTAILNLMILMQSRDIFDVYKRFR